MIHGFEQAVEQALQIFIVVMAFQTDNGVRHVEQMLYAFTDVNKCEVFAKKVLVNHYRRIGGLYWWCEELTVNP